MKTSELTDAALDWAVAKCEVGEDFIGEIDDPHFYSTDWAQGGPIIERECIQITPYCPSSSQPKNPEYWAANMWLETEMVDQYGPTPLIAAMRCYVASKLGDEVEIPNELTQGESK